MSEFLLTLKGDLVNLHPEEDWRYEDTNNILRWISIFSGEKDRSSS